MPTNHVHKYSLNFPLKNLPPSGSLPTIYTAARKMLFCSYCIRSQLQRINSTFLYITFMSTHLESERLASLTEVHNLSLVGKAIYNF